MYLIDKQAELTPTILGKILQQFQTKELPVLKTYYNYYKGKQAIVNKRPSDTGKPANKVVTNYCRNITDNYEGYLTGIAIQYSGDGLEEVIDILNYNDVKSEDGEFLRQALIFGRAFEICYVDEEGKQRFKVLDPRECVPVYSNTLTNDLIAVVRFWRSDPLDKSSEDYTVEVYGLGSVKTYKSSAGFATFQLIDEVPNFYNQCPISVLSLNAEEEAIFDNIITLQDAYNALLSGEIDDWDSFCDAYLVLKGAMASGDDLEDMKKHRVLMMDPDADASYLTKNVSDTQIQNMLKLVNDNIHKIACCPDFSEESFGTSSGIALRYRLLGFENNAAAIESNFKQALQKRIELICSILSLTNSETTWRDVNITFTRNLPMNVEEIATYINQLRGLVSDETLLTQVPFVDNVDEELKKLQKQKEANMALYSFTGANEGGEEE